MRMNPKQPRNRPAYIRTSLTRSDTGPGSCEVLLVEQLDAWRNQALLLCSNHSLRTPRAFSV
jgi:hypothetical protein